MEKSHDEELHDFLMAHFHGYTVTAGNISGYWKDSSGREHYAEHREYKVAHSDPKKLPRLEKYLSDLGARIGEKWIFWQVGEDGWLLGPCGCDR